MNDGDQQQGAARSKPKTRYHLSKMWLIVAAIVLVVVVAAGGGVWWYFSNQKSTSVSVFKTIEEVNSQAQDLIDNGDTTSAQNLYADAIKTTSDASQKSDLLINQASIYYNDGNYDQALSSAKAAEAAYDNENVAQFIAHVYESKGNKVKAIEYFKKAISLVDKTLETASDTVVLYQSSIDDLNGVAQ